MCITDIINEFFMDMMSIIFSMSLKILLNKKLYYGEIITTSNQFLINSMYLFLFNLLNLKI
jgi:hypothetical protein